MTDVILHIQKDWRHFRNIEFVEGEKEEEKEKKNMILFLAVDEIALIGNDSLIRIVLDELLKIPTSTNCWIVKVVTSLGPAAIFQNSNSIKQIKEQQPSDEVTKFVTASQYIHYRQPRLQSNQFQKFIDKFKTSSIFKEFTDKIEAEKYLLILLEFSGGHFRTIAKYINKLERKKILDSQTIMSVIDVEFPLSEAVQSDIFWKWVAFVILQLKCKLGDSIVETETKIKTKTSNIRDFVHNGFMTLNKTIENKAFFDNGTEVTCYSTAGFLYSYSQLIPQNSFTPQFKNMIFLLMLVTLNSLTYDDPKAFEIFVGSHICLSLQLLSIISSTSKNNNGDYANDFTSISNCSSIPINYLFQETLEPAMNMNVPSINFSLLNEDEKALLFNVDRDSGEKRNLVTRFKKEKVFNLNTFYFSSDPQEKGIEGFIGLKTTEGKTIYILLQCKLNLNDSKSSGNVNKNKVTNALKNGIALQKDFNKLEDGGKKVFEEQLSENNTIFLFVLSNYEAKTNEIDFAQEKGYLLIAKITDLQKLYGKTFAPLPFFSAAYFEKNK